MKRFISILVLLSFAICLLSCNYKGAYEDGYADGYSDGYLDTESEMQYLMEEEFLDGYDIGYDDGFIEGYDYAKTDFALRAIEDAEEYARNQTGWSVYEAWNNISIYQDGVHPYGYELPTEEEYNQSIDTLVYFCQYLDSVDFYD